MCAKQAGSRLLTAVFKESTPRDLLLFRYRLISIRQYLLIDLGYPRVWEPEEEAREMAAQRASPVCAYDRTVEIEMGMY